MSTEMFIGGAFLLVSLFFLTLSFLSRKVRPYFLSASFLLFVAFLIYMYFAPLSLSFSLFGSGIYALFVLIGVLLSRGRREA